VRIVSQAAQVVLFVLGLFSGYLRVIAPISDDTLRIVPGSIASFSALILLLLCWLIARFLPNFLRLAFWLILAVAASGVAVWRINLYPELHAQGTVEVPGYHLELVRRVKGATLTAKAEAYIRHQPTRPSDQDLIRDLGGISEVWTEKSINDQWLRLTREYVLFVVSTILALAFLAEAFKPRGR